MDSNIHLLTTADISSLKKRVNSGEIKIDEIKKIYSINESELLIFFQEELNFNNKHKSENLNIK